MRDTLLMVPHEVSGVPVFGWGWALGAWLLFWTILTIVQTGRSKANAAALWSSLPLILAVAAALVYFLPRLEEIDVATGQALGLPIRGFGVMVTLGVLTGVAMSAAAARRAGLDPEHIYSLAFWVFLIGIAGARLFYVVQYWSEYQRDTIGATLIEIVKFTQGGLVVYGALIGATLASLWYLWSRRLPVLAVSDLIAPGVAAGLAWGRIGCYLHGCCFGGLCAIAPLGVTFPDPSPPYEHQQAQGRFHGLQLRRDAAAGGWRVAAVDPDGPAARQGLTVGQVVRAINGQTLESLAGERVPAELFGPRLALRLDDDRQVTWTLDELPARSLPVYPIQLYSSLHAALLAALLWLIYPWRQRDGQVLALLLTLYPLGRFFEELIRDDEPGRFGTPLTISQWFSVVLLVLVGILWVWIQRGPAARTFAAAGAS